MWVVQEGGRAMGVVIQDIGLAEWQDGQVTSVYQHGGTLPLWLCPQVRSVIVVE